MFRKPIPLHVQFSRGRRFLGSSLFSPRHRCMPHAPRKPPLAERGEYWRPGCATETMAGTVNATFAHRPNAETFFGDSVTTFGPSIELWPPFSRTFQRAEPLVPNRALAVRLPARPCGNSVSSIRVLESPASVLRAEQWIYSSRSLQMKLLLREGSRRGGQVAREKLDPKMTPRQIMPRSSLPAVL